MQTTPDPQSLHSASDDAELVSSGAPSPADGALAGRRYLLTGASRGLGHLALTELVSRGAEVIAVARDQSRLSELHAQLGALMIPAPLDLCEHDRVTAWAESLWTTYGAFDGVIHNAGVDDFQSMLTMSASSITRQVHLNLLAPLLINRALLPHLVQCDRPSVIVHMGSVAGLIPTPFGSVYSATKSGLLNYSEALAIELHGHAIRFISLHPGFVHGTGMHEVHKSLAGSAPATLGGTTDQKVIQALLKSLDHGMGPRVINRFPIRPLAILFTLIPSIARLLSRQITYPYLSRVARARESSPPSDDLKRS